MPKATCLKGLRALNYKNQEYSIIPDKTLMRAFLGIIILLILAAPSLGLAKQEDAPLCSLLYLKKVRKRVEERSSYDKFKHCSVSCLLARRCPGFDVFELGVIKELVDIVGPGNAEFADLRADHIGVKLGEKLRSAGDEACFKSCSEEFPESAPALLNCKSSRIP